MIFLFGVLLFLRLIIPPAAAGGIVKIAFLRGLSFFAAETEPGRAAQANAPQASKGAASAAV